MNSEIYSIISTIITVLLGGGWFINWRANKRKTNGEATQAEADGWAKQQEVYQKTIADLERSCEFIRNDRNMLREENTNLHKENVALHEKINEMEGKMFEMQREISRLGRQVAALNKDEKVKKQRTKK